MITIQFILSKPQLFLLQEAHEEIRDLKAKKCNCDFYQREIERLRKQLKLKEECCEIQIKECQRITEIIECLKKTFILGGCKEDWEKGLRELREEFKKQLEILRKYQKEKYECKITDLCNQLQDAKESLLCCQGEFKQQEKCIAKQKDEICVLEREKFRLVDKLKELECEFEKEKSCWKGKLKAKEEIIEEFKRKLEEYKETIRCLEVRTHIFGIAFSVANSNY